VFIHNKISGPLILEGILENLENKIAKTDENKKIETDAKKNLMSLIV